MPLTQPNYRPIAVGEPISRLYASILARRLVRYTEGQQLRSPTQAGYRPDLSTMHQAFALQHVNRQKQTQQAAPIPMLRGLEVCL